MAQLQPPSFTKTLCGLMVFMKLFISTSSEEALPTIVAPLRDPWELFKYGDQSIPLYSANSRKEFLKMCIYPPSKDVVKKCPTSAADRKTCISNCTAARLEGLKRAQDRVRDIVVLTKDSLRSAFLWSCWCFALFVGLCLWLVERFQFINLPVIGDPYLDDPTDGIKYRHFRWMKWISVARSNYNWSSHLRADHAIVNWVSVSEIPFKRPPTPEPIRKREPRDADHPEWNIQNMIQKAKQDRLPGHLARWFVMQDYWVKMYDWSYRRYLNEPASSVPHITKIYPRPVRYVPKKARSTPLYGQVDNNTITGSKNTVVSHPVLHPPTVSNPTAKPLTNPLSRRSSGTTIKSNAVELAANSAQTVREDDKKKEVANKSVGKDRRHSILSVGKEGMEIDKKEPDKPVATVEEVTKPKKSKKKKSSNGKKSKRKGSKKRKKRSVDKTPEDGESADERPAPEQAQVDPPPEPLVESSAGLERRIQEEEKLHEDTEKIAEIRRKSSTNEKFMAGIAGTLAVAKRLRKRMKSRHRKHKKKTTAKNNLVEQRLNELFQQPVPVQEVSNAKSPEEDCWNETLPDGTIIVVCGQQKKTSKDGKTTEKGPAS